MRWTPDQICRFMRRVGMGWGANEPLPADPVGWARAQLTRVPPMDYLARRRREGEAAAPVLTLPADGRLRWRQDEAVARWQQHMDAEKLSFARSREMDKQSYQAFHDQTVRQPFIGLEHWREVLVRGCMAAHGEQPVFERFWHFWTNHFMVAPGNQNNDALVGPYQRALREKMVGSFRDLLWQAVTHAGMLVYLDNNRSVGPRSRARRSGWTKDEINENLGRELLELFTVSPAAGYTQEDVIQTTLVLTGWRVLMPDGARRAGVPPGGWFDYDRHEPGTQEVMGRRYAAFVRHDAKLDDLVTDLARHPATARHIATKLCRAFVADAPPADAIQAVERVFIDTQGHLPAVHAAVIEAAARHLADTRKLANPETWLWQLFGMTSQPLPTAPPLPNTPGEKLMPTLEELGQAIPRCPQPDGWPLLSHAWLSREMLDRRIRYAWQFSARPGLAAERERLAEVLRSELPPGSPLQQEVAAAFRQGGREGPRLGLSLWLASSEFMWS